MSDSPAQSGMTHFDRRAAWSYGLAVFAICNGGGGWKIVPGGPFFSIFWDILPSLAAIIAIVLCLRNIRDLPWDGIFAGVLPLILSTIALANVFVSVISFWHRPYARGDLFGL